MKKVKLPNLVAILVLTLITIIMWVSLSIYHAVTEKPSPPVNAQISKPLTPTLDVETINLIESRSYVDESQIPDGVVTGAVPVTDSRPVSTPVPVETIVPEETLAPQQDAPVTP